MSHMHLSADENGNTQLHYAAHADNLEKVQRLLLEDQYNILDENASGLTPLHFAAFGGNLEVFKFLLSKKPGAINHQSLWGSSLLHEAIQGKSLEVVNFLLEEGADKNLQDTCGNTPLHLAASLKPPGASANICKALLRNGADPTIQNQDKENFVFTILRGAATENLELLITLALQHQTDLLSRNASGLTALDEARRIKAPQRVIRLIQNKTKEQQMVFLKEQSLPFPVIEVGIQSGRPRKKVKLFVCGHSGVGKTTFVNTLKETGLLSRLQYYISGPETPPSTQGVSCTQADLKDGSLVIWDFAGQMEYCFTHSLLLNTSGPNTIYCVVFSLKGIESDLHGAQRQAIEQMIFWLRFLSLAHNPDSLPHVILIGSHLDTLPEENNLLIANRFYENVMKREMELFDCFQKHFFPINCKKKADVEPIKNALEIIVANMRQEPEPEICQLVMEHLCQQKVRFQRWQEFVESITQWLKARGCQSVCHSTLLTAVEYLHNISELLYLPQYLPPRLLSSGNCDSTSLVSSGVIILDMNWLLQKIFARFGNFALSPASGTDKQLWRFEEVFEALDLIEGEEDTQAALELLETLELLLCTPERDYVVPAWLKRSGLQRKRWENLRGVVYRSINSRIFFSHFFVGRIQIQLIRIFGKDSCKLWKEGALLVTEAQVRIEVSKDKRSLYLIGCWGNKDKEGLCYNLLEKVQKEVETLLRNGWDQNYEKLHLCPTELHDITEASCTDCDQEHWLSGITREIKGYSFEQILNAEKHNASLCGSVQTWEILFPQHDTRILRNLKWNCSTHFIEGSTLEKLYHLLDTLHPTGLDWRWLAELLGNATISTVKEIEDIAKNKGLSPTSLILNRYPVTVAQLKQSLNEMNREDCIAEIEKMMTGLCN
ncbi:death-associated protein kinase 1-like [Pyxicephalus adspersus]|uniref:death-associated protein kinase 1-like n=1 Tax=Pyxicephalus adspersus TaxID=30357 RepID=UPI003B5CFB2C